MCYPAISTFYLLVAGRDGRLCVDSIDGAAGNWSCTSAGGVLAVPPAAVVISGVEVQAFVEGTDRALWYWSNVSGWHSLGGRLASKPAVTFDRQPSAPVDAFVEGAAHPLWH